MSASLPREYFEVLYADGADPWHFATSSYERAKYDATLAALPMPRIGSALEIGCSIGVLTRRLAERCTTLLAVDIAENALAQARAACAASKNVAIARMRIPMDWPPGRFDVILLSEVLYYLSVADLTQTARRVRASLEPQGHVLLVHYILPTNYPATGDTASEGFIAATGFAPILQRREAAYRLDLLRA
jgi:cyclopropane fatty-acyl-phospholipid synthase-like methyltransferase